MDIRTLHETGDVETLDQLVELVESANSRVEREIVQLTIDMLGPRPGVALGSIRLLVDDYLPWLERRSVLRARKAGTSWAGIARLLRRSRQSVHARFVRPVSMSEVLPPRTLRRNDPETNGDADDAAIGGGIVPW